MISLSNIIKASSYQVNPDKKNIKITDRRLSIKQMNVKKEPENQSQEEEKDERIIKAELEASRMIDDARRKTENILNEAQSRSESMLEEARQTIEKEWEKHQTDVETIRKQAFEQGRQEGFAQGRQEGEAAAKKEYEELLDEAAAILRESHVIRRKIIAEAEPFLIDMATAIAKKIVIADLSLEPQKIIEMVREALTRVRSIGEIVISVDPQYLSYLSNHRQRLIEMIDGQSELVIVPDRQLSDGSCVIQTAMGSIDVKIDTQLQEIKNTLLQVAEGSGEYGTEGGEVS